MSNVPIITDLGEKDPFSQAYSLQARMAMSNPSVAAMVKPANCLLFTLPTGSKQVLPLKREIGEGDVPELRILPKGATINPSRDSDHVSWLQKYDWQVATGNMDVEASMFPLSLALLCSWMQWHKLFGQLTWQGSAFVHVAAISECQQGITIEDEARGIRGWASVFATTVDIWLPIAVLKTFNKET
jgi:hypothetical protein